MISNIDQRILFYDSSEGGFTDITKLVNSYDAGSASLTFDVGDYLYIGSYFPINHKYFGLTIPNSTIADISIESLGASKWCPVVNIIDYTASSLLAPMNTSGILQFTPDRDEGWNMVGDTSDEPFLTEFANGPTIYDRYWSRISFSASVSFTLKYVGSLFASEEDLLIEYPHLRQPVLLDSWKSGKTSWLEQLLYASEYVIKELTKKSVIIERSQILDTSILQEATVHKAAQIIYTGLGAKNYEKEIGEATKRFSENINLKKYDVDKNANGQKERYEKRITTNRATR